MGFFSSLISSISSAISSVTSPKSSTTSNTSRTSTTTSAPAKTTTSSPSKTSSSFSSKSTPSSSSSGSNWRNSSAGVAVSLGTATTSQKQEAVAAGAKPSDVGLGTTTATTTTTSEPATSTAANWRNSDAGVAISLGTATEQDYQQANAQGASFVKTGTTYTYANTTPTVAGQSNGATALLAATEAAVLSSSKNYSNPADSVPTAAELAAAQHDAVTTAMQIGISAGSSGIVNPTLSNTIIDNLLNPFYSWKNEQSNQGNEAIARGDYGTALAEFALPTAIDWLLPTDAVYWASKVYQGKFSEITPGEHAMAAIDALMTVVPVLRIFKGPTKLAITAAGTVAGTIAYNVLPDGQTEDTPSGNPDPVITPDNQDPASEPLYIEIPVPYEIPYEVPVYIPAEDPGETETTAETGTTDTSALLEALSSALGGASPISANTQADQNIIDYTKPALIAGGIAFALGIGFVAVSRSTKKHGNQT